MSKIHSKIQEIWKKILKQSQEVKFTEKVSPEIRQKIWNLSFQVYLEKK